MLGRLRVISPEQAAAPWPENVRRYDVLKGLPFPAESVDYLYSSHMLEHIPRDDCLRLVAEMVRVLKPTGLCRLALPDLRPLIDAYVASDADDAADEFIRGTLMGVERSPSGWGRLVAAVGAKDHLWMYDHASLTTLCRDAGFRSITRRAYQEGDLPDLETIETRDESIFLELRK